MYESPRPKERIVNSPPGYGGEDFKKLPFKEQVIVSGMESNSMLCFIEANFYQLSGIAQVCR